LAIALIAADFEADEARREPKGRVAEREYRALAVLRHGSRLPRGLLAGRMSPDHSFATVVAQIKPDADSGGDQYCHQDVGDDRAFHGGLQLTGDSLAKGRHQPEHP